MRIFAVQPLLRGSILLLYSRMILPMQISRHKTLWPSWNGSRGLNFASHSCTKKASSRPVVRLLGWMGLHEKIQTSLILTQIISILQKLVLKSHGRFNRTLKFFITIYDRIGLIWSPLLACWYHPIHFLSGFDLTCNQNVIWTGKKRRPKHPFNS